MGRPLLHPSVDAITVAGILYALSDPLRLAIVHALAREAAGQSCTQTTAELAVEVPKSTCSQHYRILRESGLIRCERRGTELVSQLRSAELEARFPGLLSSILDAHAGERRRSRARRAR